ncbi:MAG: hypothetical protein AB7P00_43290, partial [Sandaracinaceae bacterium]
MTWSRAFGGLGLASLSLLVLSVAEVWAVGLDPVELEAYAHSLRRGVELVARLVVVVAYSRLGIVSHY